MAKEYIDREMLLADNTYEWFDDWGNYTSAGQAIVDAPTADVVEVVHGEWESYPTNGFKKCSVCKKEYYKLLNSFNGNYCLNCGAKMDGKKVE